MDDVQVQVAARRRVDLQMAVGQLTERVVVTAASPLLETDTSQRGQVITGEQMRELALNGREYSALALLATGVRQSALNKSNQGTPREGAFNVNGLRSTFNNFLIDGVDNNAYGTSNQGFSNQVMQPPPDAVGEFRVVTNNQSAEYGRAAGATVNVAYRSGTNQFHGDAWEFFRDTALNATTFFKPADGQKPPLRRNQYGGVLGGPIVKNKAFFFGDYEGFRQNRKATAFSTLPTAAQNAGILVGRHSRSADRRRLSGGHADSDDRLRAQGARRPAGAQLCRQPRTTTRSRRSSRTTPTRRAARSTSRLSPTLSMFGRYGWRDLEHRRSADDPAAVGRRRQRQHLRAQQAARRSAPPTCRPIGRCSKCASAGRTRRAARIRRRSGRQRDRRSASPGCRPTRASPADCRRRASPAIRRSAGRRPTRNGSIPTVWNPKVNYSWLMGRQSFKAGYEFQHIDVEVQDVNPLYGLDTYTGQFTRPAGAAANNIYNLADFMLGLRSQYALSTFFIAEMRQQHALRLSAGRHPRQRRADAERRAALRVRHRRCGRRTTRLTNFDPVDARDGDGDGRIDCRPRAGRSRPQQLRAAARLRLHARADKTVVRGGWGTSYVHINRIGSANLLGDQRPAGRPRRGRPGRCRRRRRSGRPSRAIRRG